MIGEWNSEDDIAKARPEMIGFFGYARTYIRRIIHYGRYGTTFRNGSDREIRKGENNGKILHIGMLHS